MSAFVCTQKHFKDVRTSLEHNWSKYRDQSGIFNRMIWPNDIDHVYDTINKAVTYWQRLQVETVGYKYAHGDTDKAAKEIADKLELTGEFEPGRKLDRVQLYKALQCISYQIETEHLPRKLTSEEKLYLQLLETIINDLPADIVRDTEDYKEMAWSID